MVDGPPAAKLNTTHTHRNCLSGRSTIWKEARMHPIIKIFNKEMTQSTHTTLGQ